MTDQKQQPPTQQKLRMALPTGHMQKEVLKLLEDAGVEVSIGARAYRPSINLPNVDVKMFKPQNLLEMLHVGTRDVGFAGADWVANLELNVVEVMDLKLDPVNIVAATPDPKLFEESKNGRNIVVASEYDLLTKKWAAKNGLNATIVHSFGSTESFPPEDADVIVDNTATGSTLKANGLTIVDTLMSSSTRLFAHPGALKDPVKKKAIDELVLILQSALNGRQYLVVEFNMAKEAFDKNAEKLPCMKAPTVSELHHSKGYAVKLAVLKSKSATIIPLLKSLGAEDILVYTVKQVAT